MKARLRRCQGSIKALSRRGGELAVGGVSEGVLAVGADSGGVLAFEASKRSDAADKSRLLQSMSVAEAPATDMLCKYAFTCGVQLLILIPRVEKSGVAVLQVPPPTPPPPTA